MISHPDFYQKLVAARHAQFRHEIKQARMLAQMKQRQTFVQLTIGSLGRVLIVLGSYMQRTSQRNDASLTLRVDVPNP